MDVSRDELARELIEHSLANQTLVENPAPELARGVQVAVYGAGSVGRQVATLLRSKGVDVAVMIDQRAAQLRSVDGIPVVLPTAAREASMPVVIGIFNREVDPESIHTVMRAAGAVRIIDFLELHARFSDELGARYWLVSQDELRAREDEMLEGLARWSDSASREHYARLLAYRLTADPALLPVPLGGVPYRPADLPQPQGPVRFVDGGAFDGDTVRSWKMAGMKLENYWGFEPDPENFKALVEWWHLNESLATDRALIRAALGARMGTAQFSAGSGEASSIGSGGIDVAVCALDETLGAESPTELKLDIEGAEPDALEGARALIVRARPRLAICAYHRCDHLWTVAQQIESFDSGYALHLRPHAHSGFDAVAYGIQP